MNKLPVAASAVVCVFLLNFPCRLLADDAQSPRDASTVDEIIVSARRIDENQQRVPVPVTAFGDVQLQRLAVQNATDLSGLVPNVQIAQTGAGTGAMEVFIRGIGLNALAFNLENPVGIYLDDVYLGRIQGALLDQLDFERIEVLRGPQGTLYGRDSTVGALKYVTKQPDLNDSSFKADVSLGNYQRVETNASASFPIIPGTLAAKVDVGTRNIDGYIVGVDPTGKATGETGNGVDRQSARVAVLWLPGEGWNIRFTADYSVDRSGSTQGTPLTSLGGPPNACNSAVAPCRTLFNSPYDAGLNDANSGHTKVSGLSVHVDHALEWGSFKSISSYRQLEDFDAIDFTAIPDAGTLLPDTKHQSQESQEFQLASRTDQPLTWLVGLFYFREDIFHDANFVGLELNHDHQISNSYAAFADANYRIIEGLHLDVGGRISKDDKNIDRAVFPVTGGAPIITGSNSFSTDKTTYKIGLDYNITPDIMPYVTYSTGYRPGSYANTYPYPAVTAVLLGHTGPETAENVEVGVKSEWFEKRLRINLNGFDTRYKDLQQQSSTFPYPITTYNIALKGIELETETRLFDVLTLYGNLGLLDARIDSGVEIGVRPRFTPKVQYAVGGEYKAPVTSNVAFFAGGNVVYTSEQTTDDSNLPSVTQDAYTLVSARLGLSFFDDKYRVSVIGKNLTNRVYFLSTSPDAEQFFAPPRMIWANFAARF